MPILIPTTGPDDWRRLLASPEKHWRTGYSARALAYCWQAAGGGLPGSVAAVLSGSGVAALRDLDCLLVLPEHKVPLPGGGRASQSDIWVLAKGGEGLVSIAVEGKVVESFGPTLGEWLVDASPGKAGRLAFLCATLGLAGQPADDVRYQLLHRAASAVVEARRFGARHALFLVHSFSQEKRWLADFQRFAGLFGAEPAAEAVCRLGSLGSGDAAVTLHAAWVTGEAAYLTA